MSNRGQAGGPEVNPIAIVGMGCMFPKARDLTEYWRLLRNGTDAITETPATHWGIGDYFDPDPKRPDMTYCHRGGFLSPTAFDPTEFGIPPTILEATDTSQLLGLVVAKAALEDAGYGDQREFNRERTSVVLGITGLQELALPLGARLGHPIWRRALAEAGVSTEVAEDVIARIADGYVPWQENSFPGLLGNVVAGRIANRLNLRGTNCVVDAACASSLSAVHLAMMELTLGRCDMALAGGVDTLNDIFMYMCFSKTPALSPTGDARPFSEGADGTVLGEGIGMLVLKRLADAQRDGDRIYAVIRAMGTSSDGRSQSIYAPHAGGQARALRNAYDLAGVEPDAIGMIEAHGTGTKVGDAVEFDALRTVFREARSDGTWCAVGSVKSQIGHTKAAAGAAGLIKTALSLYHRVLPPTIKIDAPNGKMGVEESPFYLNTQMRPWVGRARETRRAGVSSFGFGGSNFHAVLEEPATTMREPAWDGSVQIIAMSADDVEGLRGQVEVWREAIAAQHFSHRQLAFMAQESRKEFSAAKNHRLVIVLEVGQDLGHLVEQASSKLMSASVREWSLPGIYYGSGEAEGKVALLLPGQGSQYVQMGRDLACTFPEFQEVVGEASQLSEDGERSLSAAIYPTAVFSDEARAANETALRQTEVAQPALGAVSLGMARVLARFGVNWDFAAGHSYGELAALCVAGVIDSRALHQLSRLRGRLMAAGDEDRGAMLAVRATLETIEALIAEEQLDVVLANRNAPEQGVLSGRREEIALALEACNRRGIAAMQLQVSGAYHSSLMQSAVAPLRNALGAVEFAKSSVPVFATSTGQPYPEDADEARELLGEQLLRPVEFVSQVRNLYDSVARTFIEVGPKAVLTGLVESILGDRLYRSLAVDASGGRRSGVADFAKLLAQLAAEGRAVELSQWERPVNRPRTPKMVVPLVGANYRDVRKREEPRERSTVAREIQRVERQRVEEPLRPEVNRERSFNQPQPQANAPASPAAIPVSPLAIELLRMVQEGIAAMQTLQQQTAAAHQRFLEGQEQAHRVFQQMMENQNRLLAASMGVEMPAAPVVQPLAIQPTIQTPASAGLAPRAARPVQAAHEISHAPQVVPSPMTVERQKPVATPRKEIAKPVAAVQTAMKAPTVSYDAIVLDVVCEKTGYPLEMIDLGMDIEADLGIDSIKRVEIVAAVEERIPSFGGIKPEYMGSIRTLGEIVAMINSTSGQAVQSQPMMDGERAAEESPASVVADDFSGILVDVVSQLTGYPREMIDLTMDMEADLGIDSIKRVEILAAVESRVPGMPAVQPEYMGSLRTLQQIVEYCGGQKKEAAKKKEAPQWERSGDGVGREIEITVTKTPTVVKSLERRVLKVVELPAVDPAAIRISADREVWVTDDGTPLAAAVAARIGAAGLPARVVNIAGPIQVTRPVGGLIVLGQSNCASEDVCSEESATYNRQAFLCAKQAAKELVEAAANGGAVFATVARMDGALGLMGNSFDAGQGGLAGLVKTAAHEWPRVWCKAIDVAAGWSDVEAMAEAIVRELATDGPVEVGLDAAVRRGIVLQEMAVERGQADISSDDVFVITGGARGVTAEAAVALAERYRPKLVLLGRSAMPGAEPVWLAGLSDEAEIKQAIFRNQFGGGARPKATELQEAYEGHMSHREMRENLKRIAAAGAQVIYRSVDVRDEKAVRAVMQEIEGTLGVVCGIVHAAGVLEDRFIADKTPEQFDRVFGTKVQGLRNLLLAVQTDELRHLVLYSSVSARFGNRGQADYAMANEVLNKTARLLAKRWSQCRVSSLNWGPWDGGMVGPSLKREFTRRGVELIPLEAGAKAFVDELADGSRAIEVVLGAGFPAPKQTHIVDEGRDAAVVAPASESMSLALERTLDLAGHPFLQSHVLGGRPVLPFAVTMEWMGHAAMHMNPGLTLVGMDDVRVLRGVTLDRGAASLRFMVGPVQRVDERFFAEVELRGGDDNGREAIHAKGMAILANDYSPAPAVAYSDSVAERVYRMTLDECYADVLFHGSQLRGIEKIEGISSRGLVARVATAPSPERWMMQPLRSEWLTDPLVIDSAFQMAILWCAEEMGMVSLPSRVGTYRQYRAAFPRDGVTAVLEVRERSARKMVADITFFDLDAAVVARIDGYECTADPSLRDAFRSAAAAEA